MPVVQSKGGWGFVVILIFYRSEKRSIKIQVKSRVTPRGNVKAARSVNHRGLPGGGGLWVCMRRPRQLYGPREMGVHARAQRC
jgi:hypothetical protein